MDKVRHNSVFRIKKVNKKSETSKSLGRTVHCVKCVRIRRYSGPYFLAFGLNTDQNNSEYRHFLHSGTHLKTSTCYSATTLIYQYIILIIRTHLIPRIFTTTTSCESIIN